MQRLRSSSFLSSVTVLLSGTALAQVIPVLLSPILARLFTPEEFGVLGVFTAFIGVSATVVGLSFPLAIVSNIPRRTSAQLTMISLMVTIPMATISVGVMALLMRNAILGFEAIPLMSLLFAWLVLVFLGAFGALRYWQIQEQGFRRISIATVSQSLGRMGTQLLAGVLSVGGTGLIFGEVVGRFAGLNTLAAASWNDIRALTEGSHFRDYLRVVKEFRRFPLLSTPSSLINSLALELPVPLLTAVFSLSLSGQFSLAYRSLAIPVSVVAIAVADVFHGQIARLAAGSMEHTRALFLKVTAGLFGIGVIPSIIVFLWGSQLFEFVFGSQWTQAGAIASAIIFWLLASFVVSPLTRVVLVFRGQELKLIYDIIALAGVIGAIWYGAWRDWTVVQTSWLLGGTQTLGYVVYYILLWHILKSQPDRNSGQMA